VLSTVSWGMPTSTWVTMYGPCSTTNMTSPSPEPWETGQFSSCTLGTVQFRPSTWVTTRYSMYGQPWETCSFALSVYLKYLNLEILDRQLVKLPGGQVNQLGSLIQTTEYRTVHIFTRDETGLVCLPTQLESTLQLY
jgi:hypothetical protein